MEIKKIWAVMLAVAITTSLTACGNDNDKAESKSNSTEDISASAAADGTTANENGVKSVKVYYGWGDTDDEAEYTAEIFCPEGAEFSENTLENYEEDGSVMTVDVIDEDKYKAISSMHWHRDAYNNEPTAYPIIAQLYFDGELDAETAAENSGCSQNVTPLGFKWNGYDVVLIETKYTFLDYGEQTELFAGVEYDLNYWKAEEGTGKINDLTTKALFGFDMSSLGVDDLTQEQCAWIAGELFGVDSGVANPFAEETETEETVADVDAKALIGKWVDNESDWEDTYIFNSDGTGIFISGPEYPFTYKTSGNALTLTFEEDDTEDYTVTVDDSKLVLVDKFSYEQSFEKVAEEKETETDAETDAENDSNTEENANPNVTAVIGTWKESETGIDETFTFNADGTGSYSCLSEGGTYECDFTYEFFRSDYIDIYYNDGDEGGFQIVIDGDKMTVRNEYTWDLVYTRQ